MTNDLGTLVVVVLKARNLQDKHSFYKQDVFSRIQLQDTTLKTRVEIKGGQHPVWDEELRVPVSVKTTEDARTLHVSCWSQEPRNPDLIGKGKVDISETLRTGEFDDWVPLEIDGKYKGELYLEMTFYAAGPPPSLSRRPSKLTPKDRLAKPSQDYVYSKSSGKHTSAHGSKSPATKQAALPPLLEEVEVAPSHPAEIPSLLRAGKPPGASHRDSAGSVKPPSPQRSPKLPASLLPAPAALRPGRPQSQGSHPQGEHSHTPRLNSGDDLSFPSSTSPSPYAAPHPRSQGSSPRPEHAPTPSFDSYDNRYSQSYPQSGYGHGASSRHGSGAYDSQSYPLSSSPPRTPHSQASYPQPEHSAPPRYSSYDSPQQAISSSPPQTYAVPALPREPQPPTGLAYAPPTYRAERPPSQPEYTTPSYYSAPSESYATYPGGFFPTPDVPQGPPPRPYPYNYAPPPRDPDLDVPPPQLGGYYHSHRPSFSLPDEPAGVTTPTPAHPRGRVPAPSKPPAPPLPPKEFTNYDFPPVHHSQSASSGHQHHHSHSHGHSPRASVSAATAPPQSRQKSQEESDRDRMLALAIEKEEEERKRLLAEQEERDIELARKLDLELNLEEESARPAAEPVMPNGHSGISMPGTW